MGDTIRYELWVRDMHDHERCYHPGPFAKEDVERRAERLNGASSKMTFFKKECNGHIAAPVERPPYASRAPESTEAYHKATDDGTLDWRRRDIIAFIESKGGVPQTADDYYAAQKTGTTGYGTQFALLRRAGYLARAGRKQTRSDAYATSYVRGPRPIGPDFGDKGHFAPYNVPIRATIKKALEAMEEKQYDAAYQMLADLLEG